MRERVAETIEQELKDWKIVESEYDALNKALGKGEVDDFDNDRELEKLVEEIAVEYKDIQKGRRCGKSKIQRAFR